MQHQPLSVVVLSLLSEGPSHAYDLLKKLQARQTKWRIRVNVGAVYRAVERLNDAGLVVEVASGREGNRPERRVYEITEQGQMSLRNSVIELLSSDELAFDPFRLGVTFLDDLDLESAVEALRTKRTQLRDQLLREETVLANLAEAGLPRRFRLVYELDVARTRSALEWISALVSEISSGDASWDEPIPTDWAGALSRESWEGASE